ncbi:hypothetical protein H6P81_019902 [Aristolochia fimbriata]|uniref:tRNA/rRNA methyltransferase SpoU type domain-containing protein n=1 Tax=Aristolochia fimbriata TaxID=158543 RepID=A0AAV7DWY4_ARIFI|nr:hypothetical protein H6P81_019902 [Aristolochia fimbriata]
MGVSKPVARTCVSAISFNRRTRKGSQNFFPLPRRLRHPLSGCLSAFFSFSPLFARSRRGLGFYPGGSTSFGVRSYALAAISSEDQLDESETPPCSSAVEVPEEPAGGGAVEELISNPKDVRRLMKMERRSDFSDAGGGASKSHWFPYLDEFKLGEVSLNSSQILEALDAFMRIERKERIKRVVGNRSYGVSLVVEGLADFGNVSAAFRSADALGFQSVHVISCDSSKRYRDNRHVSKGAEKWLDIEVWNSTQECFKVLKSRGYRIATTHVGIDTVSIYDMDWSCPTAIVMGNELKGISEEALQVSDLHCSIPMNGMVDSFNVSVAAGILMHHAVCDRTSRLGRHGDLTLGERQILLAEFSLRHSKNAISIALEYAKRKNETPICKL